MIRFACPACKAVLESPDQKAGSKVNCPKCGQRLQIPGAPVSRSRTVLGALLPGGRPKVIEQPPTTAPAPKPQKPPLAPSVPQPPRQPTQPRSEASEGGRVTISTDPASAKRKGPIIALVGCLVLLLVLCSGGGLVAVMFGGWLKYRVAPDGP